MTLFLFQIPSFEATHVEEDNTTEKTLVRANGTSLINVSFFHLIK